MWTKSFNVEVIVICFLSLIPWPGPSVFKITCSRESARVVRKIVQSKWIPILEKYQVKLPLECPFHPQRDIFAPQQAAKKQHRTSQWTCGFCGKSFFEEKFLDVHFETRHKSKINMNGITIQYYFCTMNTYNNGRSHMKLQKAEDAICLSDYCDIMRCEILVAQDSTLSFGDGTMMSTDVEIWSESTAYRTALSPSGPRDLAKLPQSRVLMPTGNSGNGGASSNSGGSGSTDGRSIKGSDTKSSPGINKSKTDLTSKSGKHCDKTKTDSDGRVRSERKSTENGNDESDEADDSNATYSSCEKDLVDSALPPVDKKQQKISELQKLKANCQTDDLDKLKGRCESIVRNCITGLVMQLSDQDFKEMEDEMNRAVCWYLTCDRYWEDGPSEPRSFPWGLVFVLVMVLSLGVCFCYYIIWVLFDSTVSDDHYMFSASVHATAHSSPTHTRQPSGSSLLGYHTIPTSMVGSSMMQLPTSSTSNLPVSVINQISTAPILNSGAVSGVSLGPTGQQQQQQHQSNSEEFYATPTEPGDSGQSEHYIYVTYPPELKRRLLESCYNRTTRL